MRASKPYVHLKRDFGTETINPKWCADITYIHVQKEDGLIWRLSWICAVVKSSAMSMAHL